MRLMMGLCWVLALGCTDKDTGDTDLDTGTDADTEAPLEAVSVGGTVSGLFNGDVVLQVNGGQDVTVSEDGAFTFTDAVLQTEDFDVSVATAPTGQSCEVVGGTGTAQDDITNVEVVCGCAFVPGVGDARAVGDVQINDINALNYNAVTPLRGIEGTIDWVVACGSVSHTLIRSEDVAPDADGTMFSESTVAYSEPIGWSANTAWAYAGVVPSPRRGISDTRVLYRASAPDWQPELVLHPGLSDGTDTIERITSADVGPDGVVVARVLVDDNSNTRPAVAKVDGDTWSVAFNTADGVDVDGINQPVCNLGDPMWSAAGQIAVPVAYGMACLTRGISSNYYSGILVVSDDGTARIVLEDNTVDGDAGALYEVADLQVDDVGHAVYREWRCPQDAACRRLDGGTGLGQVDLTTGALASVARRSDTLDATYEVFEIGLFDVASTGEVAVELGIYVSDCRRGCSSLRSVAWWDGALQSGVLSGEPLQGYVVDREIRSVQATSSGRMGVIADVWQGSPNNEKHQAMLCWDAESEASIALGRATNDQTDVDVTTVLFNASLNDSGNFAAIADGGDEPSTLMMIGTCP